jgi:hypothetical protein
MYIQRTLLALPHRSHAPAKHVVDLALPLPWARVVRAPGSAIDRWLQTKGALVASRPAESLIPSQAGSGKARLSRSHFWVALAERDVPGRAKSISFQLARTALLLSVPFRAVPTTSSFRNVW